MVYRLHPNQAKFVHQSLSRIAVQCLRGGCELVYENHCASVVGAAAESFRVEENGSLRAELERQAGDGEL
jgi:hypothetical protein